MNGEDDVTPLPAAAGSGTPPGRTAVGAPSSEPYEDLLRVIDRMRLSEFREFMRQLRLRYPKEYEDVR